MTEEEYFRKNYPDSCYGDRPLSPHWDFFQDGVEFGERQSENKIEEFEEENRKLILGNKSLSEKLISVTREKLDLQKENTELRTRLEALEGQTPWKDIKNKNELIGQLTKAKEIINDLVHLGEFNEHTDEEYFNYQVHEALKNAEQFISEVEK